METLLLPGMDGTGELFASFAHYIDSALRPRVVAFPRDRLLGYEQLLDHVDVPKEPFAIVAESFSGPLAIKLAATHPDRLRAMVLVATFVRNPAPLAGFLGSLFGTRLFEQPPPGFALRWALLGTDAADGEVNELRSVLTSVDHRVMADRLRQIRSVDVREQFASCKAPTFYLAGRRDRLVGGAVAAELQRLRPDMETHVLDAPHLVLQRKPIEAARLISAFLLRHAAHGP